MRWPGSLLFGWLTSGVLNSISVRPANVNHTPINIEPYCPQSCKDVLDKNTSAEDGLYYLTSASGVTYMTFCDMNTAGGGWTLVASIHENNMFGKCTVGDRWSSQQGNNPNVPEGDGNWANRVTFGSAEAATSDDFKNPGYYDIAAEDVSVWHVPNDQAVKDWKRGAILRYHTDRKFLRLHGGNLYSLFMKYPVRHGNGRCNVDRGPSIEIKYDHGSAESTTKLYGPRSRGTNNTYSTMETYCPFPCPGAEFQPGFITFRAFNAEKAAMAVCSGVKPTGCNTEHYCIGGGGFFPEGNGLQCGDFTGFDWSGYASHNEWSASKELTESSVLIFYR